MKINGKKSEKGISFILSIFVLIFVLGIGVGISSLVINQIKVTRDIGNSVVAFYAADHGIEQALSLDTPENIDNGILTINGNQARYDVTVYATGEEDCNATLYCIISVGNYRSVKRAVRVEY